jgi:DNA-nicking Smr family endonuclease
MERRGRKRFLSDEEIELWARVTRSAEPLAPQQPLRLTDAQPTEAKPPIMTGGAPNGAEKTAAAAPAAVAVRRKPKPAPPHAPFDPRIGKKIARGRHSIDARLDLHGLRQQDAYVVLRRFLARCQANGLRHVLLITGKGGEPDNHATRDFWQSPERGVLRRLVPQWLAEPSFRLHVVSFTESAMKHGGSGALYVTIRKGSLHLRPE